MSKEAAQNLKNHARVDPPFHMVLVPVAIINLVVSIVYLVRQPHFYTAWLVVLSIAAFILILRMRMYPVKVQDRVIRLEERLRLQALAPVEWHAQIYRLTEDQLIGLRFAPDGEVIELAKKALDENLNRRQIKERIRSWQEDNWRV